MKAILTSASYLLPSNSMDSFKPTYAPLKELVKQINNKYLMNFD